MPASTTLKNLLRPWVFRLRAWRAKLSRRLRPGTAWNGRHHPALLAYPPWQGVSDGSWVIDFLGVRTDPKFRRQFRPQPAGEVRTAYPTPHAQYFEIAFTLEAVLSVAERKLPVFSMIELGAGYGTWLAVAARAATTRGLAVDLVGVEMVPRYCTWMQQHLATNGVRAGVRILQAAVSDHDGEAWFEDSTSDVTAFGQELSRNRRGRAVPCHSLETLLRDVPTVSLIHSDVQGEEGRAFAPAMSLLSERVERVIVSTHRKRIHRDLRRLLTEAGFAIVYDFGVRRREQTPFGDVQFLDGLLCARNRRLVP